MIGRYRWVICALLFFATTINYIDRQILSLLKPILDDELKWTNEQFGEVNAAFQGAYAIGLLCFGWFINRVGPKIGYTVSIIAWSIAAIGHALVGSIRGFLLARVALGLGEGGNFPSAVPAVAQWFPKKERAFATSLFNAGTNVGAIIAPAIIPPIAYTLGWKWAFIFAGVAGFLWLLLWIPLYSTPEASKRVSREELAYIRSDADEQHGTDRRIPWLTLLKYRPAWSFIAGKFLTDPVWWFFLIWLPDFFKKTLLLDIKKSWVHLVSIYAIVTVFSILGGWITGHLTKLGWTVTRARKVGMILFALCVVPVMFATHFGRFNVDATFFERLATAQRVTEKLVTADGHRHLQRTVEALPPEFPAALRKLEGRSFKSIDAFLNEVATVVPREQAEHFKQPLADCARDNGYFWFAVLLIGLAGAAHQAWSANLYTTVSDLFPKYAVASLIGIGGMAGSIGGMMFPKYTGKLLDHYTALGDVTGGYTILFTICGFAYLVAFVVHHLLAPRFEQVSLRE